ncbi:hypothetical protein [Halobaculum magnesiiphilum]|uniref:Uncharacterized protein n=1 Tax=Halobaculum magnesiiphilum TaxID=1017351 RepID=A0A8T8WBC3_9EURY|nr:hypothetical protein [Halobaculum magnesiiphilum]QZP37053.1 hypothetical protein K6T50_12235 [Halobaculum magnesiiphilum]
MSDLAELREERESARRAFEVSVAIGASGTAEFAREWYRDVAAEIAGVKGCRAASERVAADGGRSA